MSKKTVLKVGSVHEYNADGSYNYTLHVEMQLKCLEMLGPEKAAPIRARFDAIKQRPYAFNGGDHINKVARDISGALDGLAPTGMYYGIPRDNCNINGFWPDDWINAAGKAIGPRDVEVRMLGACVIG